ncbi:Cytokinesis protein 3 [Smittium mucronatum]|uniref:Cytokinesis protein 3 n=1 Tax=Smittium mucronatum TaxID=133383 RepID=A0A1R0GT12_9FUNG|nr:Cytokinesis protein 3 [Smittium mucronatum]
MEEKNSQGIRNGSVDTLVDDSRWEYNEDSEVSTTQDVVETEATNLGNLKAEINPLTILGYSKSISLAKCNKSPQDYSSIIDGMNLDCVEYEKLSSFKIIGNNIKYVKKNSKISQSNSQEISNHLSEKRDFASDTSNHQISMNESKNTMNFERSTENFLSDKKGSWSGVNFQENPVNTFIKTDDIFKGIENVSIISNSIKENNRCIPIPNKTRNYKRSLNDGIKSLSLNTIGVFPKSDNSFEETPQMKKHQSLMGSIYNDEITMYYRHNTSTLDQNIKLDHLKKSTNLVYNNENTSLKKHGLLGSILSKDLNGTVPQKDYSTPKKSNILSDFDIVKLSKSKSLDNSLQVPCNNRMQKKKFVENKTFTFGEPNSFETPVHNFKNVMNNDDIHIGDVINFDSTPFKLQSPNKEIDYFECHEKYDVHQSKISRNKNKPLPKIPLRPKNSHNNIESACQSQNQTIIEDNDRTNNNDHFNPKKLYNGKPIFDDLIEEPEALIHGIFSPRCDISEQIIIKQCQTSSEIDMNVLYANDIEKNIIISDISSVNENSPNPTEAELLFKYDVNSNNEKISPNTKKKEPYFYFSKNSINSEVYNSDFGENSCNYIEKNDSDIAELSLSIEMNHQQKNCLDVSLFFESFSGNVGYDHILTRSLISEHSLIECSYRNLFSYRKQSDSDLNPREYVCEKEKAFLCVGFGYTKSQVAQVMDIALSMPLPNGKSCVQVINESRPVFKKKYNNLKLIKSRIEMSDENILSVIGKSCMSLGQLIDLLKRSFLKYNEKTRVRAIYIWILKNIELVTDRKKPGRDSIVEEFEPSELPENVFETKKSRGPGFSYLFNKLAISMGIETHIINGTIKLPPPHPDSFFSGPISPTIPNHVWNSVCINGEYLLMDLYGSSPGDPLNFEEVEVDKFFLAKPFNFIYTHMPTNSEYQYLSPAISYPVFWQLPCVKPSFFSNGLNFLNLETLNLVVKNDEIVPLILNLGDESMNIYAEVEIYDAGFYGNSDERKEWPSPKTKHPVLAQCINYEGKRMAKVYVGVRYHDCFGVLKIYTGKSPSVREQQPKNNKMFSYNSGQNSRTIHILTELFALKMENINNNSQVIESDVNRLSLSSGLESHSDAKNDSSVSEDSYMTQVYINPSASQPKNQSLSLNSFAREETGIPNPDSENFNSHGKENVSIPNTQIEGELLEKTESQLNCISVTNPQEINSIENFDSISIPTNDSNKIISNSIENSSTIDESRKSITHPKSSNNYSNSQSDSFNPTTTEPLLRNDIPPRVDSKLQSISENTRVKSDYSVEEERFKVSKSPEIQSIKSASKENHVILEHGSPLEPNLRDTPDSKSSIVSHDFEPKEHNRESCASSKPTLTESSKLNSSTSSNVSATLSEHPSLNISKNTSPVSSQSSPIESPSSKTGSQPERSLNSNIPNTPKGITTSYNEENDSQELQPPSTRVKIYGSTISGNRKYKTESQHLFRILETMEIPYEFICIAADQQAKSFIKRKSLGSVQIPQIYVDGELVGFYDDFIAANEDDELETWLGLDQEPDDF